MTTFWTSPALVAATVSTLILAAGMGLAYAIGWHRGRQAAIDEAVDADLEGRL